MKRFIAICTYAPSTHLSPSIWICQTPSIHTIHICMGAWDVPSTPRTLSYTPKSEGGGRDSVSPRSDANDNCWSKCNLPDISDYKLMAFLFVLIHANQNCQSRCNLSKQPNTKSQLIVRKIPHYLVLFCSWSSVCLSLLQHMFPLMELNVLLGNNGGD